MTEYVNNVLERLNSFLQAEGFVLYRQWGPDGVSFGNRLIEYEGEDIVIKAELDRNYWSIKIAPRIDRSSWHDLPLVLDAILGECPPSTRSLAEQVRLLIVSWPSIATAYNDANSGKTVQRLKTAAVQRLRRTLPIWPDAVKRIEAFVKTKGFYERSRYVADDACTEQNLELSNDLFVVRMSSKGGWHVEINGSVMSTPTWRNIRSIIMNLDSSTNAWLTLDELAARIEERWDDILAAATASNVQRPTQGEQPFDRN